MKTNTNKLMIATSGSAFAKLLVELNKSVIRIDKADTANILYEGVDAWNAELDMLEACDSATLELAKEGGNIFAPAMEVYSRIHSAMAEALECKKIKEQAGRDYAKYTGMDFTSILEHNADPSRKATKARHITMPVLKELRTKRESLSLERDSKQVQLLMISKRLDAMPESEQAKLNPLFDSAISEFDTVVETLASVSDEIVEITNYCKTLEEEHGYSYDANGKRCYNKTSEFNRAHSDAIKVGRTALTEFKKYEKITGIQSVIPLGEVKSASKLFGIVK